MSDGRRHNRHTLVKFFPLDVPRRLLSSKEHFMRNLGLALASRGLAPAFLNDIRATYFGRPMHVGMARQWVEGKTLQQRVFGVQVVDLLEIFASFGAALARFHLLGEDADFRRQVIEGHFSKPTIPVLLSRLEEWRRGAVVSLVSSPLRDCPRWRRLYDDAIEAASDVVDVVGATAEKIQTAEALRLVFGHNDCSPSNVVVSSSSMEIPSTSSASSNDVVYLIDEEWAAPNIAVYDFANVVMTMTLLRLREQAAFSDSDLRLVIKAMAAAYIARMKASSSDEGAFDHEAPDSIVDAFVNDIWAFVPVAALTHCFSNLIHASKEGQLTTRVPVDDALFDERGTFNWLRHATDHLLVLKQYRHDSKNLV